MKQFAETAVMTAEEVQDHGLRHALRWLERSGFRLVGDLPANGQPEFAVDSPSARILVRVCIGVAPSLPPGLTQEDVEGLRSRAASMGRRPYAAKVMMDAKGRLLDDARWLALR